MPADKSNVTVVIDKLDYSEKLSSLVGDGSYRKVKKGSNTESWEEVITDPKEEHGLLYTE